MMQTTSIAINTISKNDQLDVVYADISKAFNIAPHKKLINKLSILRFSKPLLRIK